jgi:hypothetical protein
VETGTGTETGGIVTARPEGTVGVRVRVLVRVRRVIDAVRSHRVRVRVQVRGSGSGSGFVFGFRFGVAFRGAVGRAWTGKTW